jgi:hypothetical protein
VEQTTDSNNDRLKRNSENRYFGKNRYVHPNVDDDNKKTSGADNKTQSGNVKASSKAQELIRNPRGSPLSTGNGEMKGPVRSQKPEKLEERLPNPLIQPDVEISQPAENFKLPKLQPISAVQQPLPAQPISDSRVEVFCVVDQTIFNVFNLCFFFGSQSIGDNGYRRAVRV